MSGTLHDETFEYVEEVTSFEGDMNKHKYNADIKREEEEMTNSSHDEGIGSPLEHSMDKMNLSTEKNLALVYGHLKDNALDFML